MEPRAAVGEFDRATGDYTLYTTSQNPHVIRLLMGAFVLQIPESKLRVVAPDVGGGFGSKIFHYAEEALLTWAAGKIGRPIKWTADRSESFMSDAQGRDHVSHAELAMDKDGKFLALRVSTIANMGAYLSTFAPCVPTYLYGTLLAGVYATPAIYVEVQGGLHQHGRRRCLSRRRPAGSHLPARAAGRQGGPRDEDGSRRASAVRTSSRATPSPIRRRSLCNTTAATITATLAIADEEGDWAGFEKRRAEAKSRGKLRGIGYLDISRGLRHRALGGGRLAGRARRSLRVGQRPRPSDGLGDDVHRHPQPRPGP